MTIYSCFFNYFLILAQIKDYEAVLTSAYNLCFRSKIRKKKLYTNADPDFTTNMYKGVYGDYIAQPCKHDVTFSYFIHRKNRYNNNNSFIEPSALRFRHASGNALFEQKSRSTTQRCFANTCTNNLYV